MNCKCFKELNLPRDGITSADVSQFVESNDYIKSFLLKIVSTDDVDNDEIAIVRYAAQILSERCAFMVKFTNLSRNPMFKASGKNDLGMSSLCCIRKELKDILIPPTHPSGTPFKIKY
jgi:hypothetical protein